MNILFRGLNAISRPIFGIGAVDLWRKVARSRQEAQQAQRLATQHHYFAALSLAETIVDRWYPAATWGERLCRRWLIGRFLGRVRTHIAMWKGRAEREYEAAWQRSHWLATEGRFQEAIALLEPLEKQSRRLPGRALLSKLQQIVEGKNCFQLGQLAEQAGNFEVALQHYENAATVAPEWQGECCLRRGLIAIKLENWSEAIAQVEGIAGEQAAYIRGFALARQGNTAAAKREWRSLSHPDIQRQCQSLQVSQDGDRAAAQRAIQHQVKRENWDAAASSSRKFLDFFGPDPLVRGNLDRHILPHLERELWQHQDWPRLANLTAEIWWERFDPASLHNWAIAAYYRASLDPQQSDSAIIAGSTAIANLHRDPALQKIPWLEEQTIDLAAVASQLQHRLEALVASSTDSDRLKMLFNLEKTALNLMGTPPTDGVRVQDLWITPGCFLNYRDRLPPSPLPEGLLGTLYTPWWRSILACLEGNRLQAMQLRPIQPPTNTVETFARQFLSYHEGCYYLQPGGYPRWREAIAPLQQAQSLIQASPQWQTELDRLCESQCKILWQAEDRLQFARFWHNLFNSILARNYLDSSQ